MSLEEYSKFEYCEEDFIHRTAPWIDKTAPQQSRFDVEVQQRWDRAMANGAFRYDLTNIRTRILPGPSGYVAQLNTLRAVARRAPQKITSVKQPYNGNEFNFNKVKPVEVMFNLSKLPVKLKKNIPKKTNGYICNEADSGNGETLNEFRNELNSQGILEENILNELSETKCNTTRDLNGYSHTNGTEIHSLPNQDLSTTDHTKKADSLIPSLNNHTHNGINCIEEDRSHMLVINVSPMEYGHCLLVPNCKQGLPQVMTEESLVVGIETMLLSRHRGLRLGFNSLCAFASVNHLHFHMLYLEYELISDYCHVQHLAGMYYEYTALPCPGFALQLHGNTVEQLARQAYRISNYLYEKDIAHNMFMCRGVVFGEERNSSLTTIRLFIWPRKKFIGSKSSEEFNVACIELVGHLPIKIEDGFHNLTEPDVNAILADACLPQSEYDAIKAKVIEMGKNDDLE